MENNKDTITNSCSQEKINNDIITNIYSQRQKEIIIGLTGRTGAGCTTVANILKKEFDDLDIKDEIRYNFENIEQRKDQVIHRYFKNNTERWQKFDVIEISSLIVVDMLSYDVDYIINMISNENGDIEEKSEKDIENGIRFLIKNYQKDIKEIYHKKNENDDKNQNDIEYEFYIHKMNDIKQEFKNKFDEFTIYTKKKEDFREVKRIKHNAYSFILQLWGRIVRKRNINHFI